MKRKESLQKTSVLPEYLLSEMENISDICKTLSSLLHSRGLRQHEISDLIRDVIKVVEIECAFTRSSVNSALESWGWPEYVFDEISFELISEIFESVFGYQVEVHTVH